MSMTTTDMTTTDRRPGWVEADQDDLPGPDPVESCLRRLDELNAERAS